MEHNKYLSRNFRSPYPFLVKGEGVTVFDNNGKKYLDFSSQTLNLNLGHCHQKIVNAVKKQLDHIHYTSGRFLDEPTLSLAKKLIEISPPELTKVNLKMTGGSEANECALKMVMKYHQRSHIMTVYSGFYGETFETMRCSGQFFSKSYLGNRGNYIHLPPPYCFRCPYNKNKDQCNLICAQTFERVLRYRNDIAGIIIEPIIVNAGVIIPPKEYLEELRRISREWNIALIFDEVQTAFGWLGEMFASDHFGVVPDAITLAKGLSAGFPLGVAIFNEKYDVLEYGEHEFTYGAHPISCAAALENIKILTENNFLSDVKHKAEYLRDNLLKIAEFFDCVGDVRSIGLLAGLEIIDEKGRQNSTKAKRIYEESLKQGVIFRLSNSFIGNVIIIKPPLIVSKEEIDRAIGILEVSIKKTN